jgi:isoamylase
VKFKLPASPGGSHWSLLIDTNDPEGEHQAAQFELEAVYDITPGSLRLFVLE